MPCGPQRSPHCFETIGGNKRDVFFSRLLNFMFVLTKSVPHVIGVMLFVNEVEGVRVPQLLSHADGLVVARRQVEPKLDFVVEELTANVAGLCFHRAKPKAGQ
jgi:hypothetical protein